MQGCSFTMCERCEKAIRFFTVQEGYSTTSEFVRAALHRYNERETLEYIGAYATRYGDTRKRRHVTFQLTDNQYGYISAVCENEGMTLANYFRDAVVLYIWELEEMDNSERAFIKALKRLTYITTHWRKDPDYFLKELRRKKFLDGVSGSDKRSAIEDLSDILINEICSSRVYGGKTV